jgi:3-deoxy-D-manno-octulosonate 8-phosphate phosphatase (KDO 8-P phosphatase)
MNEIAETLKERLLKIKAVLIDNDGVLTDGRIVYGDYGDELKFFDVQDGFGMVLLRRAGFRVMIVSGKKSRLNKRRAKELGVDKLFQGATDKLKVFEQILKKYKIAADEALYIGDDLIDLPVMRRAGFAAAVANAVPEAKEAAHYVTERGGGRGAVREVIDLLLKTQGKWQAVTERYYR